jgi:hypothetical protein
VKAGSEVHGGPVKLLNGKAGAGYSCMRRYGQRCMEGQCLSCFERQGQRFRGGAWPIWP